MQLQFCKACGLTETTDTDFIVVIIRNLDQWVNVLLKQNNK